MNNYNYKQVLAEARKTIDACVVVGGTLLKDNGMILQSCSNRGVKTRFLFPCLNSPWLKSLGPMIGLSKDEYGIRVRYNSSRLKHLIPDVKIRWYSTPAPGWFFICDNTIVATKRIELQYKTKPTILNKTSKMVNHFKSLFEELWNNASLEPFIKKVVGEVLQPYKQVPKIAVSDFYHVNNELLQKLSENPELLRKLHPRTFEKFVEHFFRKKGYETILTNQTRDGGKDIYAIKRDDIGELLFLIECKKYGPRRPVGVELIRALYGQVHAEQASAGILVTTSYFTKPALDFWRNFRYQLTLHDFEELKKWLHYLQKDNNK